MGAVPEGMTSRGHLIAPVSQHLRKSPASSSAARPPRKKFSAHLERHLSPTNTVSTFPAIGALDVLDVRVGSRATHRP